MIGRHQLGRREETSLGVIHRPPKDDIWHGSGGRLIWRILSRHRLAAAAIVATTLGVYASSISVPIVTQKIIDGLTSKPVAGSLWALGALAILLSVFDVVLADRRRAAVIGLGRNMDRHVALAIMSRMLASRAEAVDLGEGLNRTQQTDKLKDFLIERVPGAIFDTGGALIAIGIIFAYSAACGLVILAIAGLGLVLSRAILRDFYDNVSNEFRLTSEKQGYLAETLSGLGTIKALAIEPARFRHWARIVKQLALVGARTEHILRRFFRVTRMSEHLLTLVVVGIGGFQLLKGMLSIGELFAILMLAGKISAPLLNAGDIARQYQQAAISVEQLGRLLDVPSDRTAITRRGRPPVIGPVDFIDVSHRYAGSPLPAIADLSLRLPRSGLVALVGRNGSGKSTLLKLLQGMLHDFDGDIHLGGTPLKDFNARWLRSRIAVVNQDTILFVGTIRDNVTGWSSDVSDADIEAALRLAGAWRFVGELPNGLNTMLIENGVNLSGGQRQRLAIARAVLRDPKVILLDEPTASLDAEAAIDLETQLGVWGKGRLMILVTHHLAAARLADTIVLLDRGIKVGEGPHDDLTKSSPLYRSLWNDYQRGTGISSSHEPSRIQGAREM